MLSCSLLEEAPSPLLKGLVTYSGHTEQPPARTSLTGLACAITGVLPASLSTACSALQPRRQCYSMEQRQHAYVGVNASVDLHLTEMKRARPDLTMRALALGHCIAGSKGVSWFHSLSIVVHDVGCGARTRPLNSYDANGLGGAGQRKMSAMSYPFLAQLHDVLYQLHVV